MHFVARILLKLIDFSCEVAHRWLRSAALYVPVEQILLRKIMSSNRTIYHERVYLKFKFA